MKLAFIAHPLRGDIDNNLDSVRDWYRFFTDRVHDTLFLTQWVIDCEVYDDSDEGQRRAGIDRNLALLEKCDALYLVGSGITPGMQEEMSVALKHGLEIFNYTGWDTNTIEESLYWVFVGSVKESRR